MYYYIMPQKVPSWFFLPNQSEALGGTMAPIASRVWSVVRSEGRKVLRGVPSQPATREPCLIWFSIVRKNVLVFHFEVLKKTFFFQLMYFDLYNPNSMFILVACNRKTSIIRKKKIYQDYGGGAGFRFKRTKMGTVFLFCGSKKKPNIYFCKILLYAHIPKFTFFFLLIDVFFVVDSKSVIRIFWPALVLSYE